MFVINDVLQLADKPRVYLGQVVDALDVIAFFQCLCDGEDAEVGRIGKLVIQIVEFRVVIAYKTVHALPDHAQALLDNLFKRTSDRHDFAYRLHARTDAARYADEFGQVPARNLADEVIERGSYVSRVGRAHFANLVKGISQSNLSGYKGERITGGFRSQCRRAAQAGVHFDDAVIIGVGIERELDVTFAHDAQMAHALFRNVLQHSHLCLSKRACRSYYDGFACMDA